MTQTHLFNNGEISLPIRRLDDGNVEFDAEQSAIGLGICLIKNNIAYVRWERVRKYLNSPQVEKGDFITESQFYKLAIKANNSAAEKFQDWVTGEVLPSIRREGAYVTPQTAADWLNNPDVMIDVLQRYKQEIKKNQRLHDLNQKMKPKADYTDTMLANPGLETTSMIAKNYGYSAVSFNRLLHELGIQYKQGQTWLLYSQYQNKGYTHIEVYGYQYGSSRKQIRNVMKWTQRGVKFLYDFLKQHDILPMVEQLSFGKLR